MALRADYGGAGRFETTTAHHGILAQSTGVRIHHVHLRQAVGY
jgi:hypothetical protein